MSVDGMFASRLHFPVSTLGPGRRVAVWFQGCSIRCPGCISRDTWEPAKGWVTWAALQSLLTAWLPSADGLTISGGEPFEQPQALQHLTAWWQLHHGGDILIYSGFPWERLTSQHSAILAQVDGVVSEPYDASAPQTLPLRGSDNQVLHLLTDRAETLYANHQSPQALDVAWEGSSVWLAGIPRQGDMARIQRRLAALGVIGKTSQQPRVFA